MKKSLCFAIVGLVAFMCLSASAKLLVYEPFAYPDGWLTGQGGALGTAGTWTAYDTVNQDWRIHQEGDTSGIVVDPGPPVARNMFDGTVANLATSGGYVGLPGPEDVGEPDLDRDFEIGRYMDGSIALDPSVTATFQSGTTTWFSYVAVRAWDRNMEVAQLQIATDPSPNESRASLYNLTNLGNGIGAGGGPPRNDRFDIMPRYHSGGDNYNLMGAATAWNDDAKTAPDETATMLWVASDDDGFGAVNIIVGKIEWDADTGGEDIISVVDFLETDVLSEVAFDALIALKPDLSSRNWTANKPNLDQSQFDVLNFAGTKFFLDEIRIATTFDEVVSLGTGDSAPFVDAGVDMITWCGQGVQLDPNIVDDGASALFYAWSADPADGVEFSPIDVQDPIVTITKATDNPSTVTLTLAVSDVLNQTPVVDTMTIDVYDDACEAAIGTGLTANNPADLDRNCIIDFDDFALMATTWLDDNSLTVPVPK